MHPVYGLLMRSKPVERVHQRMQSCRNAKDGDVPFYRAMHPSGMQYEYGARRASPRGMRRSAAAGIASGTEEFFFPPCAVSGFQVGNRRFFM
jgi:hypothetical protein